MRYLPPLPPIYYTDEGLKQHQQRCKAKRAKVDRVVLKASGALSKQINRLFGRKP